MTKIILLKQIHLDKELFDSLEAADNEGMLTKQTRDKLNLVAESQFKIAKEITARPGIPIVWENVEDEKLNSVKNSDFDKEEVKALFPTGLPDSFSKLSFLQRRYLAMKQAGIYLIAMDQANFYSDHAANILITHSVKNSNDWVGKILSHQAREFNTLERVKEVALEAKSDVVMIQYGGVHDFEDVLPCYPNLSLVEVIDCAVKPKEILKDNDEDQVTKASVMFKQLRKSIPFNCDGPIAAIGSQILQKEIKARTAPPTIPPTPSPSIPTPPTALPPAKAPSPSTPITQNNASYATQTCMGVLAIGLLGYGLFKCCFERRDKNINKGIQPQSQTNKKKHQSKFKKD